LTEIQQEATIQSNYRAAFNGPAQPPIDEDYRLDPTNQQNAKDLAYAEKSPGGVDIEGRFGEGGSAKSGGKKEERKKRKQREQNLIALSIIDSIDRRAYLEQEAKNSQDYIDNYNANIGQIDGVVTETDPDTGLQVISQAHIDQLTNDVQSVIEAEMGEQLSSDPEERQAQIDATYEFLLDDPVEKTFTQEAIDKYGAENLAKLKELKANTDAQQLEKNAMGEQAYKENFINPELQKLQVTDNTSRTGLSASNPVIKTLTDLNTSFTNAVTNNTATLATDNTLENTQTAQPPPPLASP